MGWVCSSVPCSLAHAERRNGMDGMMHRDGVFVCTFDECFGLFLAYLPALVSPVFWEVNMN